MNWTLNNSNIESVIKQILLEKNIKANIEAEYEYSPMAYNYRTDTFKFSNNLIQQELDWNGFNPLTYVRLLTYHEVGHYLDFKGNHLSVSMLDNLIDIDVQIALEENAWKLGMTVVPQDLKDGFDEINGSNLRQLEFRKYHMMK